MVFQWFGVNAFVALYYDMVAFNSIARLHARSHTDHQRLIGKLYSRRTFWTYHFISDSEPCERGTVGGRERRREKREAMRVKKKNCVQKKSRD